MEDTTPRINLNGNSAASLVEEAQDCWQKLTEAQDAFASATPHGRNWQTEADDRIYQEALRIWQSKIQQLEEMKNFIVRHVDQIYEQERT